MQPKIQMAFWLIGTSIFLFLFSCKKNSDLDKNELSGQTWSIQNGMWTLVDFSSNSNDILGRNGSARWPIGSYKLFKSPYSTQDRYNIDGNSIDVHFDINEKGGTSYFFWQGYYEGRLFKINTDQLAMEGKSYDLKDHTKFITNFWGRQEIVNHVFKINIDRKLKGPNCTQGYILVNGEVIAYSLELPDLNNQNYISSIPKGTYDAKIRTDGDRGWRIELIDVPNRSNVQIHVGNYTSQIEGCILIGTIVDLNNCSVLNNYRHEAMLKLQNKFNEFTRDLVLNQVNPPFINIQVEITGI